jgi:glycosyltransferase involved in cell wall biosynthesis
MMQKKLILFTASYPYSVAAEDTFLDPELRRGIHLFSEIIAVPSRNEGSRNTTFSDLVVEEEFAGRFARFKSDKGFMIRYLLKAVARAEFYHDISANWKRILNPLAFLKTLWVLAAACLLEEWLYAYIEANRIDINRTIFYTFWCNEITLGLALVKKRYPEMEIVSRANGYDIYEEQNTPPYIPFRKLTFSSLKGLYTVSKLARDYLAGLYPEYAGRMFFAHMGVADPGFTASASSDGTLRIVSCAYIVPVKRIRLMADGIIVYAKKAGSIRICWTHIGGGEGRRELEAYAKKNAPGNLNIDFAGYIPSVYDYYRTHEVDFLISTSASEGVPVSIMEAESCGIPVIATGVGGVPEIVNGACGQLLPPDPTPAQVADGIRAFVERTARGGNLRHGAHENWKTNYNAETNYTLFYNHLLGISPEAGQGI